MSALESTVALPLAAPSRVGRLWPFGLLCLLMVFDFADRMVLAALLPSIRADWQISDTQSGLFSSVLTLGMVLFAFPAAWLIDRWSRIRSAATMGLGWSVACAAGALAQTPLALLASRALVGVGEAGYAPAAYAWISDAFPSYRRQLALGLFSAAQPVGMAVGAALGGWLTLHFGWHSALGWVALPGFLVALLLLRQRDVSVQPASVVPPHVQEPQPALQPLSRRDVLRTPSLLLVYLSGALATLQWGPLVYFLPSWLHRDFGLPAGQAANLSGAVVMLTVLALPLGGWLMDRWSLLDDRAKLAWPIGAGVMSTVLFTVALTQAHSHALALLLIALALFCTSSAGTGPLALTQELVPQTQRGFSGTCSIVAIHLLGSVPGPLLAGALSDRDGLGPALATLCVTAGLAYVLVLALALRTYRRDRMRLAPHLAEAKGQPTHLPVSLTTLES